nr:hypothetical protein [Tanacetum cinerariifolium]
MCDVCEGLLRGGFCLSCDLKAKNSFTYDPNAYSFNNTSSNFNHLPQPRYKNYLCDLCGNKSHDGYDCQQQFLFVYVQEPSYNQNYDCNYYPHDSPSFPCCNNCGGFHATFQCHSIDQNIDFSGLDQIQSPQYPDIHPHSQEISEEVFQAKGDLMKSIQTFLEEFNCIPFGEKPKILLQAWDKFFAIQHTQPKDSNELFQKLLEDLQIINKELTKCNHPTFFDDNEDHYVQYKEYLENSSKEIAASNSNQEKEKPPQDFDIRQLVREECCIEVCEEQKQNMEDTMLELVEVCRQKECYCMHDNVDDLIESALNSKLLSINLESQRLDKKKQEVKNIMEQPTKCGTRIEKSLQNFRVIHKTSSISLNHTSQISPVHAITPVLPTEEPEYSLSMGEYEVTKEDKRECDVPDFENSPIFDDHSEILSDSNNDDISSDEDAFEDIEYVEALLLDPEIVILEEENDVYQENEEFNLEDIQDVVLREKLLSINRLIANIESLNDNPTLDRMLNTST